MAEIAAQNHDKRFNKLLKAQRSLNFSFTSGDDIEETESLNNNAALQREIFHFKAGEETSAHGNSEKKKHIAMVVVADRPSHRRIETPKAGPGNIESPPVVTPPIFTRVRIKNKCKIGSSVNVADITDKENLLAVFAS